MFLCAIERLRFLRIELPSEKELTRIVNTALNGYFLDIHQRLTNRLGEENCKKIDQLLRVPSDESFSLFQKLKASAGRSSMNGLKKEVNKLQKLRTLREVKRTAVGITKENFAYIPFKVQKLLFRRAKNETASKMKEHPEEIRYGLMSCFISIRTMEVIDNIVDMFLTMIHFPRCTFCYKKRQTITIRPKTRLRKDTDSLSYSRGCYGKARWNNP